MDLGILGQSLSGGYLNTLPPNATREEQIAAINDIFRRLNEMLKTQSFSDGDSRRMIIGYQKDGWGPGKDFGIKIAVPGVDVMVATQDDLIFSMDMETWRWFEPTNTGSRNYVNIGKRANPATYGFEMAKPGQKLDDPA